MKFTVGGLIPLLAIAACASWDSAASARAVEFSAVALNDSVARRGDSIDIRSDTRSIRAFTVRYTRGVRAEVPRVRRALRAIAVTLATGPSSNERITGYLRIRPGDGGKVVRMTSREVPGLRATFRTGRTPELHVTGLPDQTHRAELLTVGRARVLLRNVGRCVRHVRRDTNVIDVTFEDGRRGKTNRNRVSCGYDF